MQDRYDASSGLLERRPTSDELAAEDERLRTRSGQIRPRIATMARLPAAVRQAAMRRTAPFPMAFRKAGRPTPGGTKGDARSRNGHRGRRPAQVSATLGAVGSEVNSWALAWGERLHHGLALSVEKCSQLLTPVDVDASTGTDLAPSRSAPDTSRLTIPPPADHSELLRHDGLYFGEDPFSSVERGTRSHRGNPRWQPTIERGDRRRRPSPRVRRNRRVLAAAVAVLALAVVPPAHRFTPGNPIRLIAADRAAPGRGSPSPSTEPTSSTLPSIAPARPGPSQVIGFGSEQSGAVALTFDDGYCDECVGGLVAGAERTGAHITLCPNGMYGDRAWNSYAARIKVLIAKGQVVICNHTWGHKDLTELDADQIRTELTRNEDWIQATFGVTSRPFFRPPYGIYDAAVQRVAADLGYTRVLMWSGSTDDSYTQVPDTILAAMRKYAEPGHVILAHGNRRVTADLFDELVRIARQAGLRTVTVAEMFPNAR